MKNFILYLSIAILIIIGSIFYLNQNEPVLPSPSITEKTTLNIWIQDSFSGSESYFNQLVEDFKDTNPNIHVSIDMIQGTDAQVYNYISEKTLNGTHPDILLLSLHNYNAFTTEKKLYSLTDYLSQYDNDYFIPSVYNNSEFMDNIYGLAYYIDPEVIIYRKEAFNSYNTVTEKPLEQMKDFIDLCIDIKKHSSQKDPLSIPTLTYEGKYIRTIIGKTSVNTREDNEILSLLSHLYNTSPQNKYDYAKISSHNFFNDSIDASIEPLSLLYTQIEDDYNLKEEFGILEISSDISVNSTSHYISIFEQSTLKEESLRFLDLFFSEREIVNRYRFYKLPIICYSKKNLFINDNRFDNTYVWQYLKNSFHYPISLDAKEMNKEIDVLYENTLNHSLENN